MIDGTSGDDERLLLNGQSVKKHGRDLVVKMSWGVLGVLVNP